MINLRKKMEKEGITTPSKDFELVGQKKIMLQEFYGEVEQYLNEMKADIELNKKLISLLTPYMKASDSDSDQKIRFC